MGDERIELPSSCMLNNHSSAELIAHKEGRTNRGGYFLLLYQLSYRPKWTGLDSNQCHEVSASYTTPQNQESREQTDAET